jgi:hypothetical protein
MHKSFSQLYSREGCDGVYITPSVVFYSYLHFLKVNVILMSKDNRVPKVKHATAFFD